MKFMARLYKQKIFNLSLLGMLGFARDRKNKSIEMRIIKDAKVYDKMDLDNENFVYLNKHKKTNNAVVNKDEDYNRVSYSANLTSSNLNLTSNDIFGKNDSKKL